MKLDIVDTAFHRNGVCGAPFSVILFEDDGGNHKVALIFERTGHCAVLAVDKLAAGDIAFGSNSWRGDRYESELRKQILTPSHNPQKRDGAQHTENSPGDDKSTRQSHEVNPK